MQKRKSHCKSRNGCLNCKKRHVKCDERGPPCANCIVRECTDTCTFVGPRPPARNSDSGSPPSNGSDILRLTPNSPPAESFAASEARRLLELELMHQWSTSTYKSLCCSSYDDEIMQVQIPRWCFTKDYLMNGLLSIAALEISVEAGEDAAKAAFYSQAAMEYYDKGSATFRTELSNINEENSTALYMFSSMAWIISMAIPHDRTRYYHQKGILERTSMLMDLIMGSSLIAMRSLAWIYTGPLEESIAFVIKCFLEVEEPDTLDTSDKAAFMRLQNLSDCASVSASVPPGTYQNAIVQLRVLWREDIKNNVRGIAIAFPSLAAQNFAIAVSNFEPMALLILMHWAIMLDKLDKVDNFWWAKSVGRDLVAEISDRLLKSEAEVAAFPEFWESVAWARGKVDLPAFAELLL